MGNTNASSCWKNPWILLTLLQPWPHSVWPWSSLKNIVMLSPELLLIYAQLDGFDSVLQPFIEPLKGFIWAIAILESPQKTYTLTWVCCSEGSSLYQLLCIFTSSYKYIDLLGVLMVLFDVCWYFHWVYLTAIQLIVGVRWSGWWWGQRESHLAYCEVKSLYLILIMMEAHGSVKAKDWHYLGHAFII